MTDNEISSETAVSETPVSEPAPQDQGGPRIVVNPSTFHNEKDAACVMFNEAFRVLMELNGFEPMAEPTEAQRKFFSDTAYARDELQLRRTILARIATLDTSVKDPTPEQVGETLEFLHTVLEIGAPQNEWEQQAVQRIIDMLEETRGEGAETETETGADDSVQGDAKGGETDDDLEGFVSELPPDDDLGGFMSELGADGLEDFILDNNQ